MVEGRKIGGGGKVIFDGGLRKKGSKGEEREGGRGTRQGFM